MKRPKNLHPLDELHYKAMDLASIAYVARRKGQTENLQNLYLKSLKSPPILIIPRIRNLQKIQRRPRIHLNG